MEKGYLELISSQAFRQLLQTFPSTPGARLPLAQAGGRFLAQGVTSPENLPAMARSGMDGYGVRAADCFGATETNPTYLDLAQSLEITDVSAAPLKPGQCARLVTGGGLPPGADAVVMVEHTQDIGAGVIEIRKSAAPGENMVLAGEDVRQGQTALPAGTWLRAAEVGFLAALGITEVWAHAAPRAVIVSTGDELTPVSEKPRPGMIRDANAPALQVLVEQSGASAAYHGIVADKVEAIADALAQGLAQAEVVFVSGGSSVGVRDLTIEALSRLPGVAILAHGLAVSPGKPTILARIGDKAVWGLPGQVASAQVVMQVFGRPFLAHLAGDPHAFTRPRPSLPAALDRNLASRPGREDFVRVRLTRRDGLLPLATPILGKSGLLGSLIQADGLVSIPADQEGLDAGTVMEVQLL